jgi:hypothetical protein
MMITWEYEWVLLGIQEARMEWWFLFIHLVTIHEWPNFLNGIESNFLLYSALKSIFPKNHFFFLTLKKQIKKPESCGIEQSWVVGVVAQPYELPPWGWSVTLTEQPVTWPPPVVLLGWGGWPPMGDDFLFYYTFRCQEKKNNNDFFGKCYSYWGNSYSLPFWEEWK